MRRQPSPRSPRHRRSTLARLAAATGALLLLGGLIACNVAAPADVAPPAATPPVSSSALPTRSGALAAVDIPPPPRLQDTSTTAPPPTGSVSVAQADALPDVEVQLRKALANASSCSADNQCRSVATGGKACGGPTGYQAYSSSAGDSASIEALAAKERALSLEEARASGRMSPCFVVADPGARCVQNRCVTGSTEPGASPGNGAATR